MRLTCPFRSHPTQARMITPLLAHFARIGTQREMGGARVTWPVELLKMRRVLCDVGRGN